MEIDDGEFHDVDVPLSRGRHRCTSSGRSGPRTFEEASNFRAMFLANLPMPLQHMLGRFFQQDLTFETAYSGIGFFEGAMEIVQALASST